MVLDKFQTFFLLIWVSIPPVCGFCQNKLDCHAVYIKDLVTLELEMKIILLLFSAFLDTEKSLTRNLKNDMNYSVWGRISHVIIHTPHLSNILSIEK